MLSQIRCSRFLFFFSIFLLRKQTPRLKSKLLPSFIRNQQDCRVIAAELKMGPHLEQGVYGCRTWPLVPAQPLGMDDFGDCHPLGHSHPPGDSLWLRPCRLLPKQPCDALAEPSLPEKGREGDAEHLRVWVHPLHLGNPPDERNGMGRSTLNTPDLGCFISPSLRTTAVGLLPSLGLTQLALQKLLLIPAGQVGTLGQVVESKPGAPFGGGHLSPLW